MKIKILSLVTIAILSGCGSSTDTSDAETISVINGAQVEKALDLEDKKFVGKMIAWDGNTSFSYLDENKEMTTFLKIDDNTMSEYSEMNGFWDVKDGKLNLYFLDGDIWFYNIKEDESGNVESIKLEKSNDGFYTNTTAIQLIQTPSELLLSNIKTKKENSTTSTQPTTSNNSTGPFSISFQGDAAEKISIKWKRTGKAVTSLHTDLTISNERGNYQIAQTNDDKEHTIICTKEDTTSSTVKYYCSQDGYSTKKTIFIQDGVTNTISERGRVSSADGEYIIGTLVNDGAESYIFTSK